MEERKAYISRLLTEKLTGVITAEDAVIIDRLIGSDAAVKAEWEWMQERLAKSTGFNPDNASVVWNRMQPNLAPKKRYYSRIAIAACLAGGLLYTGYAFFSAKTTASPAGNFFAQTHISWPEDSIVLQSDNGHILNLSANRNKHINTLNVTDSSLQITPADGDAQWQTLLVPDMLTYKVILADGSTARLNSGTRIKFPLNFTGNTREVYIDGEAFFDIAADSKKPFIVRTSKTAIQVLGTSFNVNTYNNIHTSLVDGAVSTTSGDQQLVLKPGQEAVLTDQSFTTQNFDAATTLSWMEGAYYFHDVPLKNLSGILSRWFKTKIIFDTPALENKMFSGALFKDQPLEEFLDNLALSDNIHTTLKDGTVHVK